MSSLAMKMTLYRMFLSPNCIFTVLFKKNHVQHEHFPPRHSILSFLPHPASARHATSNHMKINVWQTRRAYNDACTDAEGAVVIDVEVDACGYFHASSQPEASERDSRVYLQGLLRTQTCPRHEQCAIGVFTCFNRKIGSIASLRCRNRMRHRKLLPDGYRVPGERRAAGG